MIIGIDASNIKTGGGLRHLVQIASYIDEIDAKVEKVIIWSSNSTLKKIKIKNKIEKKTSNWLNKSILHRIIWNFFILPSELKSNNCNILFLPGASIVNTNIPVVSMVQNQLPFSWEQIKKFGFSYFFFKLILLRYSQIICFKKSRGLIFLSETSKNAMENYIDFSTKEVIVIPHGIEYKFKKKPNVQKDIQLYSKKNPYKLLYVSHIWPYKNHLNVVNAVHSLRCQGFPITIDLVGDYYKPSFKTLIKEIKKLDPNEDFIFYRGSSNKIETFYHQSDGFIFASSCETYGQILTEAMMSSLPILCSNQSALPEILGDAGCYFDPEDLMNLTDTLKKFLLSKKLRTVIASRALKKIDHLNWNENAKKTFSFICKNYKFRNYIN